MNIKSKVLNRNLHWKKNIHILGMFLLCFILSGLAITNVLPLTYIAILCLFALASIPFIKKISYMRVVFHPILLCFIAMCFMPLVSDFYNYKYAISVLTFIVLGYVVSSTIKYEVFVRYFVGIMVFLTVVSLVGYCITNYLNLEMPFIVMHNDKMDIDYQIGFIYNYLPYQKDRNCGPFWEPGLFATYLIVTYILLCVYPSKFAFLKKIIVVIAILTTKSAAGYLLLTCTIIFDVLLSKKIGRKQLKIIGVCFGSINILVCTVVALYNQLENYIPDFVQKIITKLSLENIISSQRGMAIGFWLKSFIINPIFGTGITSVAEEYIWDTCTIFMFAGCFGVLGLSYTIAWFIGILRIKNMNILSRLVLLGIVMMILNKEPHAKLLFTWMFLFYFLEGNHNTRWSEVQYDETNISGHIAGGSK